MSTRFFVFTILLALLAASASSAGIINSRAKDFTLQDMNGRQASLKDYSGKVVFVDFWASWCGPCKKEFPEINRFLDGYKGSEIAGLAVNVDKKRSHVESFLSQFPNISKKLRILLDTDSTVVSSYNVAAMPTSFIVDQDGVIRFVHFGFDESDPEKWKSEVDQLLKQ